MKATKTILQANKMEKANRLLKSMRILCPLLVTMLLTSCFFWEPFPREDRRVFIFRHREYREHHNHRDRDFHHDRDDRHDHHDRNDNHNRSDNHDRGNDRH